jgi:hypothetical protein
VPPATWWSWSPLATAGTGRRSAPNSAASATERTSGTSSTSRRVGARRARSCFAWNSVAPAAPLPSHESRSRTGSDRAPADACTSSNSTLSSGQADSSALTREATGGAGDRSGRKRRRSRSAREHGVDARLELYAADGRLFHLFGRSSSKRLWRSPGRAVHPRRPVEDSRRGGQRRLIGGYRPMTRSSCRSRTPAGTSAIAPSRILVSSGEEARATRAAAREPSTRRRARGARSRS